MRKLAFAAVTAVLLLGSVGLSGYSMVAPGDTPACCQNKEACCPGGCCPKGEHAPGAHCPLHR